MASDIGEVVCDTCFPYEGGVDVLTSTGERIEYLSTSGSMNYRV